MIIEKLKQWLTVIVSLPICVGMLSTAVADSLNITERRITASMDHETMPTIGNDGVSDLVVYTLRGVNPDLSLQAGDIWYQRLDDNGAPVGGAVQVTSGITDDQLNDVSGDYIVYTAFDSTSSNSGVIMVYRISDGESYVLATALVIQEPKIHGRWVVWREGGAFAAMVKLYDLVDLGTGSTAATIAGPVPPTFDIAIGDRFAVWSQLDGDFDLFGYDLINEIPFQVTDTPGIHEQNPATSGAWVVWEENDNIRAKNMDTLEERAIATGPADDGNPSIDGDLVTWETDLGGNLDVFLYRISTGETLQVTTDPIAQYLNDVFDDLVTYVDMRRTTEDVYVAKLEFVPDDPCADLGGDTDGDGVCNDVDNCPADYNPDQADADGDGQGDVCEFYPWLVLNPDSIDFGPVHPGDVARAVLTITNACPVDGVCETLSVRAATTVTQPGGQFLSDAISPLPPDPNAHLVLPVDFAPTVLGEAEGVIEIWGTDPNIPVGVVPLTGTGVNTAPEANAGPDQALLSLNVMVTFDGTASWDPDGDDLIYQWTLYPPAGSAAVLDDATSATPSFWADVYGDYVAELVVTDVPFGESSVLADSVTASFTNVAPIADAGDSRSAVLGETVLLDGSGSTDANNDTLSYQWNFVSRPEGSVTEILNATGTVASFYADVAGDYEVSLVVSDHELSSEPDVVIITVTANQSDLTNILHAAIEAVNALPRDEFRTCRAKRRLIRKLNMVLRHVEHGRYVPALRKLKFGVLRKTDGCARNGAPDQNDWIRTCEGQAEVYPLVVQAIALLEEIIDAPTP